MGDRHEVPSATATAVPAPSVPTVEVGAGSVGATEFDRALALAPVEGRAGESTVELGAGWSSLVGVHGGFLCAVSAAGARQLAAGSRVRTASTSFQRSARVGEVQVSARALRLGRTTATVVGPGRGARPHRPDGRDARCRVVPDPLTASPATVPARNPYRPQERP